jgi:hypothetical protein
VTEAALIATAAGLKPCGDKGAGDVRKWHSGPRLRIVSGQNIEIDKPCAEQVSEPDGGICGPG